MNCKVEKKIKNKMHKKKSFFEVIPRRMKPKFNSMEFDKIEQTKIK